MKWTERKEKYHPSQNLTLKKNKARLIITKAKIKKEKATTKKENKGIYMDKDQ